MNDVGIYIKDWCGYCALAEELLSRKGVNYRVFDITNDSAGQAHMVRKSGRKTVPQIFIGNRHIGGSDDLIAAEFSGQLDGLLSATGDGALSPVEQT